MDYLKLYIVKYTPLVRGGLANVVIMKGFDVETAFSSEIDMLNEILKLKKDKCVENIRVNIKEYKLEKETKYEFNS